MALKKFRINDLRNPQYNLVAVYDIEGANAAVSTAACGIVIDTNTGKVTHLLNRQTQALKHMGMVDRLWSCVIPAEGILQSKLPAYQEGGVTFYQQPLKEPLDKEALLFHHKDILPSSIIAMPIGYDSIRTELAFITSGAPVCVSPPHATSISIRSAPRAR